MRDFCILFAQMSGIRIDNLKKKNQLQPWITGITEDHSRKLFLFEGQM